MEDIKKNILNLEIFTPSNKEEYEVTRDAIVIYKKFYSKFKGQEWKVFGENGKKRKQCSMEGYYLTRNTCGDSEYIDISADCVTSLNAIYKKMKDEKKYKEYNNSYNIYKQLYHTIGNFVPLPEKVNARTWGVKTDNWSYKLTVIRQLFLLLGIENQEDEKYIKITIYSLLVEELIMQVLWKEV